ncbi:ABC transporter permease [Leucobacter sp. OLJS4]|uniref:ABC transporter permease n=1 Tax=unclassified Leucobacter TaxID=2621730 RepID=UPI000C1A15B7|nr:MULTISPECIES: ABC transporter permease [unclassified Leucobacter]PII82884.1 ABC transporter permease [Leucobacter sp. OLCALW19]PII88008.1 ABC transporter permease [Leucobacter sp. OLTLW20]PII91866.1 ABC transporter permease [Leucobacter sp. OLAS13]PII99493.1 ABC transporter permease [Leucobacter sp. OLCS4]PIJ00188.1 ABC transporter permease [Leucobacter sp. OLDS2]
MTDVVLTGGARTGPAGEPAPAPDIDEPHRGGSWLRFAAMKAGGALVSLVMVVVLGFFAFRILPGDPVRSLARGRRVSPEQLDAMRIEMGLDQPLMAQFWRYLTDLFRGDLGYSYTYNQPVSELIGERLLPTLLLTGTAFAISVLLGLWLGQRAAWRRGSFFDRAQTGTALTLWSVPTFWLGLLLLLVFAGTLHWFPTGGMVSVGSGATGLALVLDVAHHMVLPVLTLAAVVYAQYLLVMRTSLLEEMTSDYLVTARAKGLNEDGVRRRHAVPNALLPTVTLIFLALGGLIGGAVTVEAVYSWPGLGYLTFQALRAPDFPVLQGTFVVFSAIVILMNFIADLLYRSLDPRLRTA